MMRLRATLASAAACALVVVQAQCPDGGVSAHDRCWYLGQQGATCAATCALRNLGYSWAVAPAEDPMIPKILKRQPATKQFSWGRTECYVAQGDRFHTAKQNADSNTGDVGQAGDWSVDVCSLACPCTGGEEAAKAAEAIANAPYPACVSANSVLRHAGAHAIFADLSGFGSAGCWQNDCKNTDKFIADDQGICARVCVATSDCTHWSYGEQEGSKKCFLRKSDAGRETFEGFVSAAKKCAPPTISDATIAQAASDVLLACDAGKSEACPDIARAIATWKLAIKHLVKATDGKVDAGTVQYIAQIGSDTDAFSTQMSEENFPIIQSNNRQVFSVLTPWLNSQPKTPVARDDPTVLNPLQGKLCGPNSCYERI